MNKTQFSKYQKKYKRRYDFHRLLTLGSLISIIATVLIVSYFAIMMSWFGWIIAPIFAGLSWATWTAAEEDQSFIGYLMLSSVLLPLIVLKLYL